MPPKQSKTQITLTQNTKIAYTMIDINNNQKECLLWQNSLPKTIKGLFVQTADILLHRLEKVREIIAHIVCVLCMWMNFLVTETMNVEDC